MKIQSIPQNSFRSKAADYPCRTRYNTLSFGLVTFYEDPLDSMASLDGARRNIKRLIPRQNNADVVDYLIRLRTRLLSDDVLSLEGSEEAHRAFRQILDYAVGYAAGHNLLNMANAIKPFYRREGYRGRYDNDTFAWALAAVNGAASSSHLETVNKTLESLPEEWMQQQVTLRSIEHHASLGNAGAIEILRKCFAIKDNYIKGMHTALLAAVTWGQDKLVDTLLLTEAFAPETTFEAWDRVKFMLNTEIKVAPTYVQPYQLNYNPEGLNKIQLLLVEYVLAHAVMRKNAERLEEMLKYNLSVETMERALRLSRMFRTLSEAEMKEKTPGYSYEKFQIALAKLHLKLRLRQIIPTQLLPVAQ